MPFLSKLIIAFCSRFCFAFFSLRLQNCISFFVARRLSASNHEWKEIICFPWSLWFCFRFQDIDRNTNASFCVFRIIFSSHFLGSFKLFFFVNYGLHWRCHFKSSSILKCAIYVIILNAFFLICWTFNPVEVEEKSKRCCVNPSVSVQHHCNIVWFCVSALRQRNNVGEKKLNVMKIFS